MEGANINNMRYAIDMVLIADTEEELQKLVDGLNQGCGRYDLEVNISKTEVLGVTKKRDQLPVIMSLESVF